MAAMVDPTRPTAFNISLNIGTLLSFPSRIIARLKLIDAMLSDDAAGAEVGNLAQEWGSTGTTMLEGGPPPPPPFRPFPGPWGFITSGYAVGLFAMVVLLHRIQNIVVPPRRPQAYDLLRHPNRRLSHLQFLYHLLLPLNLSSTFSRLLIYFPTLYFLSKAMLLWLIILLQVSGLFPTVAWEPVVRLGAWAGSMKLEDVCWFTYWTICAAFCVEAFTKGLEGSNNNSVNSSPFNLCGYAFLLHIYSSPVTHTTQLEGQASRPDKHVITTITIPLFQLWMIHVLGVKQSLSQLRLVPTALTALLSLIHFHTVLWCTPRSYPLLNYMPCVFDSFLLFAITLTASLNAATQILLEGTISRPLLAPAGAISPRWDQDFAVVLLKLGTASLEATKLAGLGNELGGVAAGGPAPAVELNRYGVTVPPAITSQGDDDLKKGARRKSAPVGGFANEIKEVRVTGGEGGFWFNTAWYRELVRYFVGLWRLPQGLARALWAAVRGKRRVSRVDAAQPPDVGGDWEEIGVRDVDNGGVREIKRDEREEYERFLRGEPLTDDSDNEFEPPTSRDRSPSCTPSLADRDERSDSEDEADDVGETATLYVDHLSTPTTSTSTAPLLLAHLTNTSSSPLTRRRYTRLIQHQRSQSPEFGDTQTTLLRAQRHSTADREENSAAAEARRNCVVCTVEPRQIICWPCRCLALCDECRANLGSRSAASKHRCPCCRRTVDGYSRIFIP